MKYTPGSYAGDPEDWAPCSSAVEDLEQLFRFVERIRTRLVEFSGTLEVNGQQSAEDKQRALALILVARLSEVIEGFLVVARLGMSMNSKSIFRDLLDAYFVFACNAQNLDFCRRYFLSDHRARLKLMNVAARSNSSLFDAVKAYVRTARQALKQAVSASNAEEFKSYKNAKESGCEDLYNSLYRVCSAPVHSTPRSLEEYLKTDSEGFVLEISSVARRGDIELLSYTVCTLLINCLAGLNDMFEAELDVEIQETKTELEEVMSKLRA